jgi:hypothetical protein
MIASLSISPFAEGSVAEFSHVAAAVGPAIASSSLFLLRAKKKGTRKSAGLRVGQLASVVGSSL